MNDEVTENILITEFDWNEIQLSTVFSIFKGSLTTPSDLISLVVYKKGDGTEFNIPEFTNKELLKFVGVIKFKNKESAFEAFKKLNNAEIKNFILNLAFIQSDLLHDLVEEDYCNREDLFEIEEERVDEFLEAIPFSKEEVQELLEGFYSENEEYKKNEGKENAEFKENKKSKKKLKKTEIFMPNLKDERFEKFFTSKDFLIDKSSHFYTNNKMIDLFLEEKSKRDEDFI